MASTVLTVGVVSPYVDVLDQETRPRKLSSEPWNVKLLSQKPLLPSTRLNQVDPLV